jgi:uncharacterized membrane protein YgcG
MKNRKNRAGLEAQYIKPSHNASIFFWVAAAMAATGCSSSPSSEAEQQWETVTVQKPTQGVVSYVQEMPDGKFELIEEKIVSSADSSLVVIKKIDGTTQTLTLPEVKGMLAATDTMPNQQINHRTHHGGYGMGSLMWNTAMGFMIGRSFSSMGNSGFYSRSGSMPQQGGGGASSGGGLRYMPNTATTNAESMRSNLSSTSRPITVSRPVSGGRSGFFGSRSGSSRSSGAS